jgi:hypothetical protein
MRRRGGADWCSEPVLELRMEHWSDSDWAAVMAEESEPLKALARALA